MLLLSHQLLGQIKCYFFMNTDISNGSIERFWAHNNKVRAKDNPTINANDHQQRPKNKLCSTGRIIDFLFCLLIFIVINLLTHIYIYIDEQNTYEPHCHIFTCSSCRELHRNPDTGEKKRMVPVILGFLCLCTQFNMPSQTNANGKCQF